MKILLVMPHGPRDKKNLISSDDSCFPIGLAYVAAALEGAGHHVEVFDFQISQNTLEDFEEKLGRCQFDVIGFSVITITMESTIFLAEIVRKILPKCVIVVGGPYPTVHPGMMIERSYAIDFEVIGEGEVTIVDLLNAVTQSGEIHDVSGIAYRVDNDIVQTALREEVANLDSIRWPAYHLFRLDQYTTLPGVFFELPLVHMITSRGCPFHCVFCDNRVIWRNKYRQRSPHDVIREIKYLLDNHGVKEIYFLDDTFTVRRSWVVELCNLIETNGLKFLWRCSTRVDRVDRDLLQQMYSTGCRSITYGMESGVDEILTRMAKGITTQQTRDAIKQTKAVGIEARGFFMLNFPGDTVESTEKTISFSKELDLDLVGFKFVNPYLGDKLLELAMKDCVMEPVSRVPPDAPMGTTVWYTQNDLTHTYLHSAYRRALRSFYLRPRWIFRTIRKIRNPAMFFSYLRGFLRLLEIS